MDAWRLDKVSHFPCRSGAQNWYFWLKFENCFDRKRHYADHKGIGHPDKVPNNHSYTSSEGLETIKQQWMYVPITHHHISPINPEQTVDNFHWIWRVVWVEKDTTMTIRGSAIPTKSPAIILTHLRKVRRQSSSNECMSLLHIVTLPLLIWSPKLVIFMKNCGLFG